MRRRTLLTAGSAAAISAPPIAIDGGVSGAADVVPLDGRNVGPPVWYPGEESFVRRDVHSGDRPVGASFATRTAVYGKSGAAGTAHPLATQTGIEVLKHGGSAVDAAIAMNACLGFLEPTSCGLGGDCFAMLWDPQQRKVVGLAGSGTSPRKLTLEIVRSRARNGALPSVGAVAVSTPGVCDAWWTLHQRYGLLKWADLFGPAIDMAEEGAPVPDIIAHYIRGNMASLRSRRSEIEEFDNAIKTYGEGPASGGVFRNPDLARTYRMIAAGGRDAYYNGPIAQTIGAYFKRIGGWLSAEDLAAHHSEWIEPYKTNYRGIDVYALGANTQGIATLQMLNILEHFDLSGAGFQSPLSIHLQVEAKRLAYEDRARYYADPHFTKVPVKWLISKDYAAQRAQLIRPSQILTPVYPGTAPSHGDTTYFTAADRHGLMVSMIQSNFRGMGSGLVADGLGFMFQDRGQLFSLTDAHPNIYAPGKRPFQTIIPGFAVRDGRPWMSFGVMGGDMQPQGQTQIVVNRRDYGLEVQSAGDSPRWHHEGSSQSMGEESSELGPRGLLHLESGVPEATRAALGALGWKIGDSDGGFGRYQCIENRQDGAARVYAAASEMRADGCALAY
jgi:gamma-glutamyltranspeptidase / glutathione hydrolase